MTEGDDGWSVKKCALRDITAQGSAKRSYGKDGGDAFRALLPQSGKALFLA